MESNLFVGNANDEVFIGDMTYKCGRTPIIEILAPAIRLVVEVKKNQNGMWLFEILLDICHIYLQSSC